MFQQLIHTENHHNWSSWVYSFQSLESEDDDDSCEDPDFKVNGNMSESSDKNEDSEPEQDERIKRKRKVVCTLVHQKVSSKVDKTDRKISIRKTMTTVTRPNKMRKNVDDIIKDIYPFGHNETLDCGDGKKSKFSEKINFAFCFFLVFISNP